MKSLTEKIEELLEGQIVGTIKKKMVCYAVDRILGWSIGPNFEAETEKGKIIYFRARAKWLSISEQREIGNFKEGDKVRFCYLRSFSKYKSILGAKKL